MPFILKRLHGLRRGFKSPWAYHIPKEAGAARTCFVGPRFVQYGSGKAADLENRSALRCFCLLLTAFCLLLAGGGFARGHAGLGSLILFVLSKAL